MAHQRRRRSVVSCVSRVKPSVDRAGAQHRRQVLMQVRITTNLVNVTSQRLHRVVQVGRGTFVDGWPGRLPHGRKRYVEG